ncbi:tRNA N(3)-methylcytidine methyltransferase METTL6-like isoform X1 [Daphnia pulicaria]|uniref:tRNA N(3)-methylcytidine methyltransferase METTL6-like isoform X1 n=2 Tax=Daphnia pulicaria TaxID=35523 RepID=UPI001EEA326D|nr:tRNA N(3)-methylcytidine methyltransferase METTL6-like isoform X1 [Daphnia pulicaria]XP_046643553.1 tRNA N(3)-methylcytidine methyltransferase METTL6-like isoform X1 [Daphnia pulicaria]XP_046643554.1 tRNA N(3)-methylcytidine methyltransferase METTL6-like isoform X1 [Daphnia pulicaria]
METSVVSSGEDPTCHSVMEGIASNTHRVLTEEEENRLKKQDETVVSEFKRLKLEAEAQKNWDLFYKRNDTRFFRDRHWTTREFELLVGIDGDTKKILLEIGCGVGNFLFPLLEENANLYIYGCDFSPRAVEFVKGDPRFNEERMKVFVCDITKDRLEGNIPELVDVVSLIFVLSAIHPDKFQQALHSASAILKPGGVLVFRDYGLYDMAQLRFGRGNKIGDNFYVRQDGTRSYFFSVERLTNLVADAGFDVSSCHYVNRRTVNKKEGVDEPRVFVQGKFIKR